MGICSTRSAGRTGTGAFPPRHGRYAPGSGPGNARSVMTAPPPVHSASQRRRHRLAVLRVGEDDARDRLGWDARGAQEEASAASSREILEQLPRVGVLRVAEHRLDAAVLDDDAALEHDGRLRDAAHDGEVVWVMKSTVSPRACSSSRSCSTMRARTETSRALVISSQTSTSGSTTSARAIATRWRSPPERRPGRRSAKSRLSATVGSISTARARRSAAPSSDEKCRSGSSMFSATVSVGFSEAYGFLKTYWTRRRCSSVRC